MLSPGVSFSGDLRPARAVRGLAFRHRGQPVPDRRRPARAGSGCWRRPGRAADGIGVTTLGGGHRRREEIRQALGPARVPEQREAFLLKYVEGLSYEEMAALTGVGERALKMRVKRAADRLRELLRDVYVT